MSAQSCKWFLVNQALCDLEAWAAGANDSIRKSVVVTSGIAKALYLNAGGLGQVGPTAATAVCLVFGLHPHAKRRPPCAGIDWWFRFCCDQQAP